MSDLIKFDVRCARQILRDVRMASLVIAGVDAGYLVAAGLGTLSRRRHMVALVVLGLYGSTAVVAALLLGYLERRTSVAEALERAERNATVTRHPSCRLRAMPPSR